MATADLHIAFLDGAGEGAWLEAHPSIDRVGRSLIHASCVIKSGEHNVARVLATFAVRLTGLG
jgi:acyl-coenzyme A thioesterase PaaI-like protein